MSITYRNLLKIVANIQVAVKEINEEEKIAVSTLWVYMVLWYLKERAERFGKPSPSSLILLNPRLHVSMPETNFVKYMHDKHDSSFLIKYFYEQNLLKCDSNGQLLPTPLLKRLFKKALTMQEKAA